MARHCLELQDNTAILNTIADDLTDGSEADADEFPVANRLVDGRMYTEQMVVDLWDVLMKKGEWFAG